MGRCIRVIIVLAFLCLPAAATVFQNITDRALAGRSDAIVAGTVRDVYAHEAKNGWIVTDAHLAVETVLKGTVPDTVTISEIGGSLGTRFTMIADAATYTPGERVLVFLRQRSDGTYYTTGMALGKFTFSRTPAGESVVVRSGDDLPDEPARRVEPFEAFLRGASALPYRTTISTNSLHIVTNGTAKSYATFFAGMPLRWNATSVTFMANNLSGPIPAAVNNALAAWRAPGIQLLYGGTTSVNSPDPTPPAGSWDGINAIVINYGGSINPGLCDFSEGCCIIAGNTNITNGWDGDTWISIQDADVFISPSVGSGALPALLTHELGHAIGIRHADQGTPSCTAAIMASTVPVSFGTTLQQWDKDAVNSLYGSGPVCSGPPATPIVTGGGSVPPGGTTTLTATGQPACTTVNYQWYSGMSGDTSTPVGTNSSTFTTPAINTPSNFWVSVSNTCGSTPSTTVSVAPASCQKPVITIDLQDQTITSGATATLTIGSSGSTPFTYQWYKGQAPSTANPVVGVNSSQFTTPALTQTTQYWVQVSNACGTAVSRTATITVPGSPPPCTGPPFTTQPGSITIDPGQQTFLFATATGAASYQWYQGTAPDTSTPLAGLTPTNQRYVDQLYIDLLNRPADSAANALAAQIDSSVLNRQQVALVVLTSSEYRGDFIRQTYKTYLNRSATPSEVSFWQPAFGAGMTDEQFEAYVLASPESFALAGSTSSGWVTKVFNDVLGRAPIPTDLAFWLARLGGGQPRSAVATAILESPEARTDLVQSWYARFLRRTASNSEVAGLVLLLGSSSDESALSTILATDEYYAFGSILPVGPLTATTSYWVAASNSGCSTNSTTATVTVRGCAAPLIAQEPQNASISVGQTPPLSVSATGPGSLTYQWYQGSSGNTSTPISGATAATLTSSPISTPGTDSLWVRVTNSCGSTDSAAATVTVTCGNAPAIMVEAPASAFAGQTYVVTLLTDIAAYGSFELQESTTSDFSGATTLTSSNGSFTISGHQPSAPSRYFYRARGTLVCGGAPSPYSAVVSVLIAPQQSQPNSGGIDVGGAPCPPNLTPCTTTGTVTAAYSIGSKTALNLPVNFAVTADQPWISFLPASGAVPDNGLVTVTYTIDLAKLTTGSSQATISFTFTAASGAGVTALGTTTQTVPVSVSLVTPVVSQPKDANAPPNTVILPAVAYAAGINSQFQTDVRITNTATQPITYQLTYTPANTDGTTTGLQTLISVNAGNTVALNDVVKNWYGSGVLGQPGIGTLEIRPMNYSGKSGVNVSFATVASSRTYNATANGTFGQYVPAIPLVNFLGNSNTSKISLQQIAQSSAYRTNVGFLEGAGQPVSFTATLYDDNNKTVASQQFNLAPFELQQQSLGSLFPGVSLSDGRLEFKVTSDTGKLSAYASVLDNVTSDPLLVFPVDPSTISANRFVVPGVAELNNGAANFHTDMRIYNSSASATNVTLTFPANTSLPPVVKQLAAGQVWSINNVLPTLWNTTGGGAVVAKTDNNAALVLTARTYSRRSDGGTFGQFIPGVTSSDAIGVGDRPLQIVQLEQSSAFRTNVGMVEVTGNPMVVDVAAYSSDSKVAAHTQVPLAPGQFLQLGSIFSQMGITTNFYNGRISITALSGTGRVAAYGSVIDNQTQDPTYVPAQ